MPDFDGSDYEERLRRALHEVPTPSADADTVLERVEHGVRRRVRRRRAGTATLGVAAVMTAAAVVIPNLNNENTVADGPQSPDHESSKRLRPDHKRGSASAGVAPGQKKGIGKAKEARRPAAGKTAEPTELAVSDIAVNASGDVGVIGKSQCQGGPCIVAGSPAEGVDFRIAPPDGHRLETMKLTTTKTVGGISPGIELGSDPSNWWAWSDALYSSHDSGKTWKAVKLPHALSITGVKSDNKRVWAFGVRADGRSGVASADQHGDNWAKEPVPVGARETIKTPMVIGGRVAFVASARDNARSAFVRRSASGWKRHSVPCPNPVKSTSANSTVWLGCTTRTGEQLVVWSQDDGANWDITLLKRPGLRAVGGVDAETAIVGVGADMVRVSASGGPATPVAPPFSASDDVWGDKVGYTTIRFDSDGTGWATTTGGALGRSDDGGLTWQPASLQ